MNVEEIYTYLLTAFEGKSFENLILNKNNNEYKESFENEYRDSIIEALRDKEKYIEVLNKLSKSFMTNLIKGTNSTEFTQSQCKQILDIYQSLIKNIGENMPYEKIALEHFTKVRNYIAKYTDEDNLSNNEAKGEYSAEFILDVLQVDKSNLRGNFLDIGCGKKGTLVKYLKQKGVNSFGIDMECEDSNELEQEDWLQKDYPENTYDVITSNLTFTKYFNKANMEEQNDEECFEYAQTYMKILNSLKVGGKWHYAPAVTFIEELLPEDKFEVKNSFVNENVMRTIIQRKK